MPGHVALYVMVIVPFLALAAAVPVAWGWGLTLLDVSLTVVFYVLGMLGATLGLHRFFTHRSFRTGRPLKILLGVLACLPVQGPVIQWVATHRRHHNFSDAEGDPHSPWLFGTSPWALVRGFWHAHMGWLFSRDLTSQERFAPDLLADPDMRMIHRLFAPISFLGFLVPGIVGGLVTHSWHGFFTALFWAGLVRVALVHHVTWSVNSVCHMVGARPYKSRDRAGNFWPLALASMGDAWHNLHHADPTLARHGVGRWEIDITGRIIWILERLGLARDVKWPSAERLDRLRAATVAPSIER
jgi:stearoyl-CoA desaturase (delta-9 desaturase)